MDHRKKGRTLVPHPRTGSDGDETDTYNAAQMYPGVGSFDYSTFEGELDGIVAQDEAMRSQANWQTPTPDDVVRRPTVNLRAISQDDATFDFREVGPFTVLTVRGRINETFPGARLAPSLRGRVLFDLTEVDRVTSFGVRAWLQMIGDAGLTDAYIVRASPAVVHQITMMKSFCGPAKIVSVLAPYACGVCGAEFGVTYHAIEDRTALVGRNPYRVACPDCGSSTAMDEDPWVFFGLDDQLATRLDNDVEWAIGNLGEAPRHAAIEKSMMGATSRLRLHGAVSHATRLSRAFEGLEGLVVLDFRAASDITPDGLRLVLTQLQRLPPEVVEVTLEGASLAMVKELLSQRPARVRIQSVTTQVSNAHGQRRRVVVDLEREGEALRKGRPLAIDLPWPASESRIEGIPLMRRAARRLTRSRAVASMAPASSTRQPAFTPAPTASSGVSQLGLSLLGTGMIVLGAGVLLMALPSVVGLGDGWSFRSASQEAAAWSNGSPLPPGWAEVPVLVQGNELQLVGRATSATVEEAAKLSRLEAASGLMEEVARRIAATKPDEALPTRGTPAWDLALNRFERFTATELPMVRSEEAARQVGDQVEVVARYHVQMADIDRVVQDAGRMVSFKGITVGARPPWAEPGLSLVKAASYIRNVKPGDRVLWVGDHRITDLQSFRTATASDWRALQPGEMMQVTFEHEGAHAVTSLLKPKPDPTPTPAPVDRPVLLLK